jgi:hypothetical protein
MFHTRFFARISSRFATDFLFIFSPAAQVSSPTASFSSTARQPLLGQGRTSFDFNSSDDAGISLTFG